MLDTQTPLIAEFLKDHQRFSRLLYEISQLLKNNDIEMARERADELNAIAGPHIAYEEAELYTRLADLGENSVSKEKLVGEHQEILKTLRILLDNTSPNRQELEIAKAGFRSALKHAEHCGTLISFLSGLNEDEQSKSLKVLIQLRNQGKKWTDLY